MYLAKLVRRWLFFVNSFLSDRRCLIKSRIHSPSLMQTSNINVANKRWTLCDHMGSRIAIYSRILDMYISQIQQFRSTYSKLLNLWYIHIRNSWINGNAASHTISRSVASHGLWHQMFINSVSIMFGRSSIISLTILEMRRDHIIVALCIVETWHDVNCVAFRSSILTSSSGGQQPRRCQRITAASQSLRCLCPSAGTGCRLRWHSDNLRVWHVLAWRRPSCCYCHRCLSTRVDCFIQSRFFDELSSVAHVAATFQEPVYIAGDFNLRFDRLDVPHT